MKIYVVTGHSGEYSASRDWLVCAFVNENIARDFVIEISSKFNLILDEYKKIDNLYFDNKISYEDLERQEKELIDKVREFDPNQLEQWDNSENNVFSDSFTPNYTCEEIELNGV